MTHDDIIDFIDDMLTADAWAAMMGFPVEPLDAGLLRTLARRIA